MILRMEQLMAYWQSRCESERYLVITSMNFQILKNFAILEFELMFLRYPLKYKMEGL